jgi:hypothetical protein
VGKIEKGTWTGKNIIYDSNDIFFSIHATTALQLVLHRMYDTEGKPYYGSIIP